MDLLIATSNPGKAREIREVLGLGRFDPSDLSSVGEAPEVKETGVTFRANACIKASAYARQFKRWVLADDSGLEVDALNGKPGVFSARWAEMHNAGTGDTANNQLLLKQLQDVPEAKRTARFVCVLALSDSSGRIMLTVRDVVEGRILYEPRGAEGFGYDPLFFVDELGNSTAELEPPSMSRILVAVSSPWASQRVVETVGDLAKRIGAEVLVAHVSRPSGGEMREQEQADGESAVRLLSEKLAERGVAVQTLLMFSDDIARAILNTAVEREISLIVLGLTGKNIFARLLAGNVPVELIKNTKIPVMLMPPDWGKPI
jgi:XTP/dITP diphosphohydrolase